MFKIIIVALIATVILVLAFTKIDPNIPNPTNETNITLVDQNQLTITVSGQVNRPGTFALAKGSTIADLLTIAGGPTAKADDRAYLPTTALVHGLSYFIASRYDETDVCNDYPLEKVNLNTASKDQLMTVNGIGTTIASALVNYRSANGNFTYLEEIMKVTGIGNATYEKIKNNLILQ